MDRLDSIRTLFHARFALRSTIRSRIPAHTRGHRVDRAKLGDHLGRGVHRILALPRYARVDYRSEHFLGRLRVGPILVLAGGH